jgi:hypothetical protein
MRPLVRLFAPESGFGRKRCPLWEILRSESFVIVEVFIRLKKSSRVGGPVLEKKKGKTNEPDEALPLASLPSRAKKKR